MSVAPEDLDGISPDRLDFRRIYEDRQEAFCDDTFPGNLVHAAGTWALAPQETGGVDRILPRVPPYCDIVRAVPPDFGRSRMSQPSHDSVIAV